jgi:Cu(I)/Ag(I) efflux system membrane fusion protein
MFAKLQLTAAAGGPKVILVPSKAVLCDGDQSRVIVVGDDDVFRLRVVEVGPESNGRVRVLSGVSTGETVVTDGALFLKNEIEQR